MVLVDCFFVFVLLSNLCWVSEWLLFDIIMVCLNSLLVGVVCIMVNIEFLFVDLLIIVICDGLLLNVVMLFFI